MQSPDHPELQFVEASGYTVGRPDGKPLWVVIHDMEAYETPNCAENTANYFATGAGGRSVSSHYTADDNSIVQCVLLKDSAWTVGNRPGNNRGINWELCGFARQTRAEWLDPFGLAMFSRMAPIIRSDATKYNIPLVKRTVAELQSWLPGVTSHNDLGIAFGGTDHTDPGVNFPWDYFMATLLGVMPTRIEDEDMWMTHEPGGTIWLFDGSFTDDKLNAWTPTLGQAQAWTNAGVRYVEATTNLNRAFLEIQPAGTLPPVESDTVPGLVPHSHDLIGATGGVNT